MGQIVFIPKEIDADDRRVGASPDTVKRLKALGFDVIVETGAGLGSRIIDADFQAIGATIGNVSDAAKADVVLKVRRPTEAELRGYKPGAAVLAIMDPYGNDAAIAAMAKAGVTAFAMELMPRITRAQAMDVLSSQANLAGYQAVIDGAAEYDRALPMMMTAAGTVPAARIFVMGVGVAGLQAIATARRLGARRHGHRRAPGGEGAGAVARREIPGGRGRGVQGGRDGGRLRQGNVERVPGQAGGADGRAHRQAGHRDHHGADSRAGRRRSWFRRRWSPR